MEILTGSSKFTLLKRCYSTRLKSSKLVTMSPNVFDDRKTIQLTDDCRRSRIFNFKLTRFASAVAVPLPTHTSTSKVEQYLSRMRQYLSISGLVPS
jgi:hypothetical protein